jgi:CubicO group peptidase (beta-lactamase class C family)
MPRLVLLLLTAVTCFAQDVARMEQVIQTFTNNKQFMGSVLVAKGDQVLLSKGYGAANLEWKIPNAPDTRFRLGSITKQFTAASILLLEERGKLSIDDPVSKHMPNAPAAWSGITIKHLLSHTSGIPSFTSFPNYRELQKNTYKPEQLVALFLDKPLDFPPGEKFVYSNSGYVLLGYLIEKITGQTYAEFVKQNIFNKLDMNDSGYDLNGTVIERRASGYEPGPAGPRNAGYINMTVPHAAGALYSSTEDLLRWQRGLFGGKLLNPESLAKMTTVVKSSYALGVAVEEKGGKRMIAHGGGIEGFNTFLAYYPEDQLTVAVLGNLNGMAPEQMAKLLGKVALGEPVTLATERKELKLPAETLLALAGQYELAPGVVLTVTAEGDQLMAQLTNQPKFPVFAESPTKFFYKVVDAQLEFRRDLGGTVTGLTLYQNGRQIPAKKK